LTEIKNRGVEDVCIAVCDGLKGLPEAITPVWEQSTVQTCVIHLIRNTFRYAPRQHWDELSRDLKPVYTAPTEAAARERFAEFEAAIESLNARYRRAVRARGHFPTEQAALKCLYLATRAHGPTGIGRARWATRWKPALNAFAISFDGRIN
jgi:transposase-like protein